MPAHRHPVTERSWLISGTWEALNQTQYSPSNGVPVYFEIPPGERHGGTAITECKFIDLMPESLVWIEDNGTVRYMEPDGDFVTLGNPGTADLDL
jgi:quercetin dioxygenase-like cupin family protein